MKNWIYKYPLILMLIGTGLSSAAQNARQMYRHVKKANSSIANYSDSTLYAKYTLVNRFKDDTISQSANLLFLSKEVGNHYFLKSSQSNSTICHYYYDSIYFTKTKGDTIAIRAVQPYHFDKHHNSSLFFQLTEIPTKKKGDYSRWVYSKPKIISVKNDSVIIEQYNKKYDEFRQLHFTLSDYRVYEVVSYNFDKERSDAYFRFEIEYYPYNCFDSINQVKKLGAYNDYIFKKVDRGIDSLKSTSRDTIYLQNDSMITNFNDKYLLFDYWYLGCRPCIQMMPFMQQLHGLVDTSKLIIVGVNDVDEEKYVQRYLKERNYHTFQMDTKRMKPYHDLNQHPQLYLMNENQEVVKIFIGYSKKQNQEIKLFLKSFNLLK